MALGSTLVAGCGDDDPGSGGGEAGEGASSSGGKAGSGGGGKAGTPSGGSSTTGGKAGGGGEGGTGGTDVEPMGGEGGVSTGGGGEGGSAPEPVEYDAISKVIQDVIPAAKVNDLRGLVFSATDGKLWAAGHKGINTNNGSPVGEPDKQLVIARFKANGTPDETFSDDGFLEVNLVDRVEADDPNTVETTVVVLNDGNEEALGIVELENGDIVVGGNKRDANGKGMDAYLARFTSAGVPVDEFGTDGVAIVTLGWADGDAWPVGVTSPAFPSDSLQHIELDSSDDEERIVVFAAGTAAKVATGTQRTDNDRYVTRLLADDGAIDPDFNTGKPFTYNSGGTNGDNARRGIVEADGSILAAGYTNLAPGGNHIFAISLEADGTRTPGFGTYPTDVGVLQSNPVRVDGGVAECYNVARQSNGRIVTAGYGSATRNDLPSTLGYVTTKAPDMVSFAYSADGKLLDTDWGNAGMFIAQSEELTVDRFEERGRDIAVLADDRLVIAGNFATDPAIYVANPDGSFDPDNDVGYLFRYTPLFVTTTTNQTTGAVSHSTSHFFRVVVSPDGTRIAASTNQNVDGVIVALLKVGE